MDSVQISEIIPQFTLEQLLEVKPDIYSIQIYISLGTAAKVYCNVDKTLLQFLKRKRRATITLRGYQIDLTYSYKTKQVKVKRVAKLPIS